MVVTIFSSPLAQTVLVFVLTFTLVFAILQKTRILGDGKRQIDALIALSIGLLVISVGYALEVIYRLIPFLVISLVVLLVFMLLLGSLYKDGDFKIDTWLKIAFGIIIFIAVVIAVLVATGGWDYIVGWFLAQQGSAFLGNIILVLVVVGAAALLFFSAEKTKSK
ncbi:MAG: hypothetical protein Q7K43_05260 [Candidatus Woesearchaeota archaeon]|nr:hypothetical protein [Candidatus Woesearchaeota archaeon]